MTVLCLVEMTVLCLVEMTVLCLVEMTVGEMKKEKIAWRKCQAILFLYLSVKPHCSDVTVDGVVGNGDVFAVGCFAVDADIVCVLKVI